MTPAERAAAATAAERLSAAWRAYRAGVVDASRRWSHLSPGEVRELRAQLDALRAEVFAAEAERDREHLGKPRDLRIEAASESDAHVTDCAAGA